MNALTRALAVLLRGTPYEKPAPATVAPATVAPAPVDAAPVPPGANVDPAKQLKLRAKYNRRARYNRKQER